MSDQKGPPLSERPLIIYIYLRLSWVKLFRLAFYPAIDGIRIFFRQIDEF